MKFDKATIDEFVTMAKKAEGTRSEAARTLSLLDLTSLSPQDNAEHISKLCQQANSEHGAAATVCVYPQFVTLCQQLLQDTPVRITSVANFPVGNQSIEQVLATIALVIRDGASEIDVVLPYQAYLNGEQNQTIEFIRACKHACGPDITLKIIMETGVLADPALIAAASHDALSAGADFLKTSTGKITQGATLEAVATMLLTLKLAQKEQGRSFGLKVSGGIHHLQQAVTYLKLADIIMGESWVSPQTFRFGASSLLSHIFKKLSTPIHQEQRVNG